MNLDTIIERAGDAEVLSDEAEIDAAFTARDAIAGLGEEGRIRVLSWIIGGLGIPLTLTAGSAVREPA